MSGSEQSGTSILAPYRQLPRAVFVLCVGTFVHRAGTFLLTFLALYMEHRGLGVSFATLAMSAFGFGSLGGALIGGHLADRFGRRRMMLISLLSSALVLLVFGKLESPAALLFGTAAFAFVADLYRPAVQAMLADIVTPEQRTRAFGLLYAAINLGFGIGALAGGALAARSFQWLFWVDAATAVTYAAIVFWGLPETLRLLAADGTEARQSVRAATLHILRDRTFLLFCAASLLVSVIFMQSASTLPLVMKSSGIAPDVFGRVVSLNGFMIVLLQLPATAYFARFRREKVIIAAALLVALGFGMNAFCATPWAFAGAVAIWTLGEILQSPLAPAIVTDLAPERLRGRYFGTFSMCFSSANLLGAPLGGLVMERTGPKVLWAGAFAIGIVAAMIYAKIGHRIAKQPVQFVDGVRAA